VPEPRAKALNSASRAFNARRSTAQADQAYRRFSLESTTDLAPPFSPAPSRFDAGVWWTGIGNTISFRTTTRRTGPFGTDPVEDIPGCPDTIRRNQ